MNEFERVVLLGFINAHWQWFVDHCAELGLGEDEAEVIAKKLEGDE